MPICSAGATTMSRRLLTIATASLAVVASLPAGAVQPVQAATSIAPQRDYRWVHGASTVQDRNFYLLTLLDAMPQPREAVANSTALRALSARRDARLTAELAKCSSAACRVQAHIWRDDEIASIGDALVELANAGRLGPLINAHMRPSGAFARHGALSDAELIRTSWSDAAAGMNGILRIYGLGATPRYPEIDAISFDPKDEMFGKLVEDAGAVVDRAASPAAAFYTRTLRFALTLLYLNERENAGAYGDIDAGQNATARAAVSTTRWADYPYSAILVLGDGPDDVGKHLGSFGKLRVMRAAQLYAEHRAPFLIVSGGNVHPAHTPINEAEEMKKELVIRYRIPEAAIFIEPDARHTTTNFRNSARLMFRYGFPMRAKALVTTSAGHSQYASGETFRIKAREELGYQPMTVGARLSPLEFEFVPDVTSLHRDARDPLDP